MRTAITQGKALKEEFCDEVQMRRYSRKNKYHGKYKGDMGSKGER